MIEFKIGKRYMWNPYYGKNKTWKNGILSSIETLSYKDGSTLDVGHFVVNSEEEWQIPLDAPNLKSYEHPAKG